MEYPSVLLLIARSIARTHGVKSLFSGVSVSVDEAERVGLIGPNGAGKSTLLKILAGLETPDEGRVEVARGRSVIYVPQLDRFPEGATALGAVAAAAQEAPAHAAGHRDPHEAEVLAEMVLARVGFERHQADAPAATLSGGWRKRLALACALAGAGGSPDVLLLDEPTNHLDLEGIRWLEELLLRRGAGAGASAGMASVFVTHDRRFLQSVATRIVELSDAYPGGTLSVEGGYDEFVRRRAEFLAGQARAEDVLANQVRRDQAWLARGAQARRTKAKGRIEQSGERQEELAQLRGRNAAAAGASAAVDFNATARRTRKLISVTGASAAMGGRTLFREVTLVLGPGQRLGLLGANGSGKTTFIRMLTGELAPASGSVTRADPPPRVAIFHQQRPVFPPQTLLRDALSSTGDEVQYLGASMHVSGWARRFLFRDDQLDQPVSALSGGELARVHIANIMLKPADVLILDEPTNDLDIPTLEVLEEAIDAFPGAVVLVTHDRALLERLATEILVLGGPGGATALVASLPQALSALDEFSASAGAGSPSAPGGRGGPEGVRTLEPSTASSPASPPAKPGRRRLSFNEQREFDSIEARILKAEEAAREAERRVSLPEVIADHARMARACRELEELQTSIQAMYARWAELEARMTGPA